MPLCPANVPVACDNALAPPFNVALFDVNWVVPALILSIPALDWTCNESTLLATNFAPALKLEVPFCNSSIASLIVLPIVFNEERSVFFKVDFNTEILSNESLTSLCNTPIFSAADSNVPVKEFAPTNTPSNNVPNWSNVCDISTNSCNSPWLVVVKASTCLRCSCNFAIWASIASLFTVVVDVSELVVFPSSSVTEVVLVLVVPLAASKAVIVASILSNIDFFVELKSSLKPSTTFLLLV